MNGDERDSVLKNALDLYENIHGKDSPELIDLLIDTGKATRALSIAEENFGAGSILYADVLLAEAISGSSRVSSKTRFSKAAYEIYSKKNGPESVGATLASFQLGKFKMAQGKYKSSIPYFLQATKNSNVANYAHAFLAQAYDRTNQRDKATEHVLIVAKQSDMTQDQDYLPLFVRSPNYPLAAQRKGREGYAVVRYGVMLREDGIVMDDGTTTRISENHYHMTTTTAQAANVLSHLEYYLQLVWPELNVNVVSTTEQWAGAAIAGPKSRDLLQKLFPNIDASNEGLPFMGYLEADLFGVHARIFRISFSGELAYEVNVESDNGNFMWEKIMEIGQEFKIQPYGTEALSTLRIEMGHIAGSELDGRTIPYDNSLEGLGQ